MKLVTGERGLDVLDLIKKLGLLLASDKPAYLVGGAVRDLLLDRSTHDVDFAIHGEVRPIARRVADALNGSFYMLDDDHNTARVVYRQQDGIRISLDFAKLRDDSIEGDLRGRDFTINAMALDLEHPDKLIDPLGGAEDLKNKLLRICSETSLMDDPVRNLRAVRLALALNFRILPETLTAMKKAAPFIGRVSSERQRDEIFKMLDNNQADAAIRILDRVGGMCQVLPELCDLKGTSQSSPHLLDVWEHTLATLRDLGDIYNTLVSHFDTEKINNITMGQASLKLGRFRDQLEAHFSHSLNPDRSRRALLVLAALYHDIAKPLTRQVDADGRIRFIDHDGIGAAIVAKRAHALALSQAEVNYLVTIVRHHMRPHLLEQTGPTPTRRAIYHFFRDSGDAGVDICLLSLADVLATYGVTLPQEHWLAKLDICRTLLEAWWEKPLDAVKPARLLNGDDLKAQFSLKPGPVIGELLEAIREAQAIGSVSNRQEAISFARKWLEQESKAPVKGI
jgi:poly(A) polymerase